METFPCDYHVEFINEYFVVHFHFIALNLFPSYKVFMRLLPTDVYLGDLVCHIDDASNKFG